jgi:hypothetical protein
MDALVFIQEHKVWFYLIPALCFVAAIVCFVVGRKRGGTLPQWLGG